MTPSKFFLTTIIASATFCFAAQAAEPDAAKSPAYKTVPKDHPLVIVVHRLNDARNQLAPATGSSKYTFTPEALAALPQGAFTPLNEVLLQAPGVAQDSYGQLHVRGDHADLQYRINGIIIPEGISGFGQTLDTRFADRLDLLTGALPAEYGYRTAGVINITTKDGAARDGALSSLRAGSQGTLQAGQEAFGTEGRFSYYLSGAYDQNDRGIEPPTSSSHANHDFTQQDKEFGYASYILNPENRVSLLFGNATNRFEIPNNPGQAAPFAVTGLNDPDSSRLDERQFERNTYGILALQGSLTDRLDYQVAAFGRKSQVLFKPDELGDLAFNGIASRDDRQSGTGGLQADFAYHVNDAHTIRYGLFGSLEAADSSTASAVFPANAAGAQTSTSPFTIYENHDQTAFLGGVYLQDEWKALPHLTLNYGLRADAYDAYVSEQAMEPRAGAVYELTPTTTLHGGYSRYFTPPPTELIAPTTIARFNGTTGALGSNDTSPVRPERADYYDLGILQKIGQTGLTLGLDGYYKQATQLLDEGQFGQALIFAPFNYDHGIVKGAEFTADYRRGPFSAYGNVAMSKAVGKGVASGRFNFDPDELTYIDGNSVHLDHDQLITGSAGAAYNIGSTTLSSDLLYGSGLRSGFANTDHLPFYTQVNAAISHSVDLGRTGPLEIRLDVANLFDRKYEIRDGSGIGVFAPQFGARRGFFVTLSKAF